MDKVIPRLDWREGYDNVAIRRKDKGDCVLFDLYLENGELLAFATQDFNSHEQFPDAMPGCVWVKNYSEHQGLGNALVLAGVLKPTGRHAKYGPWDASSNEYRLTPEFGGGSAVVDDGYIHIYADIQVEDIGELEVISLGDLIADILKRIEEE